MTFTPIPEGTTQWDVPLNAALQDLQDQISATFRPTDHNLLAWTYDPAFTQGGNSVIAGTVYLGKLLLENASSVTNVIATVTTLGSGLAAGQNFSGLYDSAGTLIAVTADQTTAWSSGGTGAKTMALSGAPYSLGAGAYYVSLLANGTTPPGFLRAQSVSQSTLNIGLTAATGRYLSSGTGLTSLPASITLGSATPDFHAWWFALS